MRSFLGIALLVVSASWATSAEPPLVEKYLHTGNLAGGEQALVLALEKSPKDDQVRFGLGVLRFVRAVERFGQSLYEYGASSENTSIPFLRLPVPKNDSPVAISYPALGRMFDVFLADLDAAEKTLAGVTDDHVKLPLRLADIKLDLDADRKPTDRLLDILIALNGRQRFDFLAKNKDFLVSFDRGDVAWLRAYCHLISAIIEGYRALDLEVEFENRVKEVFPKVHTRKTNKPELDSNQVAVAEPARLGNLRKHLLAVCELNRETWKFIRAEKDDDHEWLPNPKQTAVLGLRVREQMIDRWLAMIDQLEGLLKGERVIPNWILRFLNPDAPAGTGLYVKAWLDDPPAVVNLGPHTIDKKYLSAETDKNLFDIGVLINVWNAFDNPLSLEYMAWFN
jgi:hypothetical protein